jgi:hypothetical protein
MSEISFKDSTTTSAPSKLTVFPTAIHFIPAFFAANTPDCASSNTRHCSGNSFNSFAPRRKTSGLGFDKETIVPSTISSNELIRLTFSRIRIAFLDAEPRAILKPDCLESSINFEMPGRS